MDKNIYLVGFMGTGKSTVGIIVADILKREFIEIDEVIENRERMKIVDIFSKRGEKYFRKAEKETLAGLSARHNLVVSCGGGLMIDEDNVFLMKGNGIIICLRADDKTIYERIKKDKSRPLLNVSAPLKKINELLNKRAFFYEKADVFIDTENISPHKVAVKVIDSLDNVQ